MSTYLWKVIVKRTWNQVKPGMEVKLIVKDSSGEPSITYKIKLSNGMPRDTFDFLKS
jgi:hypothetical protein